MKRLLLVIGGGIAAYKCLELIRRARERGFAVRTVMTEAAKAFVTPLSIGALSNDIVVSELLDLDGEREIGHIRLARDCDIVVVAPATADLMARMAAGLANDLATAVLLATDKPVLVAPAMNPHMWSHPATQRNAARLEADGIAFVGPGKGEMAERGEAGVGRMAEPLDILAAVENRLSTIGTEGRANSAAGLPLPLAGRHVVVTAGPTHEPIDPVRYIANRSSGKQGYAIAAAAYALGARVTLISGPVHLPDPSGIAVVRVETAGEMLAATQAAMPADIGVFAAAVADWRVDKTAEQKLKKQAGAALPKLSLCENPDILRTIGKAPIGERPALLIGFAAETEKVIEHARRKLKSKGCDWIVANDVSPSTGIMGGDRNTVHIVSARDVESWPDMDKNEVARRLMERAGLDLTERTAMA